MKKKTGKSKKVNKFFCGIVIGSLLFCTGLFTACSRKKAEELPKVEISLWIDSNNQIFLDEVLEEFSEKYSDVAEFDFTISVESEITCKETVLADIEGAADLFMFADDQMEELWRAGALLEITENVPEILDAVGGEKSGAAIVAMREGRLYAHSLTAGNGYFMYYNKEYFKNEDLKSLDCMLEIAAANNKKLSMDFTSGWYTFSFFKGAGLDLSCNEDGITNSCNWNAKDTPYTGVDVLNSMLDIANHPGFLSCQDEKFVKGVQDGNIIAGVNGSWNARAVKESWGENFGAVKLPEFTLKGDSVQMCSFNGYKLVGISAYTKQPDWSMKLAKFITDEEMQLKRFKEIGECPTNMKVWGMKEVQSSPVFAALKEQEKFGYVQNVAEPFWDASCILGANIAGGNGDKRDFQELLDEAVIGITAEAKADEGE